MAQYHARDRGGDYQSNRIESQVDSSDFTHLNDKIDCHEAKASHNDDSSLTVFASETKRALHLQLTHTCKSTPLYRHCEHSQNVKQSIKNANFVNNAEFFAKSAKYLKDSSDSIESNHKIDCHDLNVSSLAMTARDDSAESNRLCEAKPKQSINKNISAESTAKLLESPKDSTTHSKPRLLHLASDLHSGGAERVFYNTIEQTLATNSYEIFIASADKAIPFNIDKSHFLRLDDWNAYSKVRGVCKYIFNLRNYRLLKRFLFTHKIDIIHTQNYLSRLSPSVLFALRKFKRKFPQTRLIFTQHGYGVCANLCLYNYAKNAICESCIGKSKLRIAIDNCDRRGRIYSFLKALRVPFYQGVFLKEQNLFDKIIFVSEFQGKKHILEGYKSTAVIANPIEHRFYNPHIKAQDKQNLIVFFGRIAKEKNIPLLIRSFVRFAKTHKDYRLLIIGNGDEKEKCQRLAEELLVAESLKDSSIIDCHEFNKLNSRNDGIRAFPQQNIDSRNDDSSLTVFASETKRALHSQLTHTCKSTPLYRHCEHSQNVKQSIKNANFVNDAESLNDSNDSIELNHNIDCHDLTSSSLAMTPPFRLCEAKPKQSIYANNLTESRRSERVESLNDSIDSSDSKNAIDCHDSTTQSLAMTARDDSANATNPTNPTTSQIDFISHLPPNELKEILKLAKITVLPSLLYETFGLSIVESILSGAVPIVSNIGALSETVERYYGVAFKNGDEVALANAMEAVVCEYERHFQALLQARSKIIGDIECKKYVSDLLNAYML